MQENEALGWYRLTDTVHLGETVAHQVYGNFYWIMRDLNKLGPTIDDNWGGHVFTTGKSGAYTPDVAPALLNHYRVQAMVEVLQGKIRSSSNQTF
jgi:hypothetical protein